MQINSWHVSSNNALFFYLSFKGSVKLIANGQSDKNYEKPSVLFILLMNNYHFEI
jgi:hypothetical protein